MRLKINLATQPYEDARHFRSVWTGLIGGLLLLAIVLSYAVVTRWHTYRTMSANITREKQIISDFDTKQQQGLAILNKSENQDVRQQSEFLNDLIRRKEISWTKIFSDLEKMMPPHLRVLSVEPKIQQDSIVISMTLGGDARERPAELVRRMEKSRTFRNAHILSEQDAVASPGQPDPLRFLVQADYVPVEDVNEKASAPEVAAGKRVTGGGE
jgi:hypothetical protein